MISELINKWYKNETYKPSYCLLIILLSLASPLFAKKYDPYGKEQFIFTELSSFNEVFKYGPFCKKINCKKKKYIYLEPSSYLDTVGYFVDNYSVTNLDGYWRYKIVLENGKKLFLLVKTGEYKDEFGYGGKYKTKTGIKPYNYKAIDEERGNPIRDFKYNPRNHEQFVFNKIQESTQKYGYQGFCVKDTSFICTKNISYKDHVGLKGYFENAKPHIIDRLKYEHYRVTLENGHRYYYVVNPKYGKYGLMSDIISLDDFNSLNEFKERQFYQGSHLKITSSEIKYGAKFFTLNNGQNISEKHYNLINKFGSKINSNNIIAEKLIDMKIEYDVMDDKYTLSTKNKLLSKYVKIYIVFMNNSATVRFHLNYYDDDWLFVDSFKVAADEYRYQSSNYEFNRDNSSGSVWEWIDIVATKEILKLMSNIANSDNSTIRFQGSNYYSDMTINKDEKQNINTVLKVYSLLEKL